MQHEQRKYTTNKTEDDEFDRRLAEAEDDYQTIAGEELTGWRQLVGQWLRIVATAGPTVQVSAFTLAAILVLVRWHATTQAYIAVSVVGLGGQIGVAVERRTRNGKAPKRRGSDPTEPGTPNKGARQTRAPPGDQRGR